MKLLLIFFAEICSSLHAEVVSPGIEYDIDDDGTLKQVSSLCKLRKLILDGLGIKKIQEHVFDNHSSLDVLSIQHNKLTQLPPLIFSKLQKLSNLDLSHNNLNKFDRNFIGLNELKTIKLANNSINILQRGDFFGLGESAVIVIEGNNLQSLTSDIFSESSTSIARHFDKPETQEQEGTQEEDSLQNPKLLDLTHIKICKTDNGTLESVNELTHSAEAGSYSEKALNKRKETLDLSGLGLKKFKHGWSQLSEFRFHTLTLSNNFITEITPELLNDLPHHVRIVHLDKNHIEIVKENVMKNTHIRKIFLRDNLISMIDHDAFKFINNLLHLSITNNHLENLIFAKTLPESIVRLDLDNNRIHEIDEDLMINLKNLVHLSIRNNHIDKVPVNTFRQLTKLRTLDISSNRLTSIEAMTFLNQNNLIHLDLSYNRISEINSEGFKGLTMLRSMHLNNNNIKKITNNTFSELNKTNIIEINLAANEIETIGKNSFYNMNISYLVLSKNKIRDGSIAPYAFNGTDVGSLYLSNNLMTTFNWPYMNISSLVRLFLNENEIMRVNMKGARWIRTLRTLDLSGNPLLDFENQVLCGLRTDISVTIILRNGPIGTLRKGIFDCY